MYNAHLFEDSPEGRTLAKKLCTRAKPGAIILLTKEEMRVIRQGVLLPLTTKDPLYFDDNLLETGE